MTAHLCQTPIAQAEQLANEGCYGSALGLLQDHLLEHPRDAEALHRAASLLQAVGRYEQAARHLEKALACLDSQTPIATQST